MNRISPHLFTDLHLEDDLWPSLNSCQTRIGQEAFRRQFNHLCYDLSELTRRQNRYRQLMFHESRIQLLQRTMYLLWEREGDWRWFREHLSPESRDQLYLKYPLLNKAPILQLYHGYQIYFPSIFLMIYLVVYILLRRKGLTLSPKAYLNQMIQGWLLVAEELYAMGLSSPYGVSFLARISVNLYLAYQLFKILQTGILSQQHLQLKQRFQRRMHRVRQMIKLVGGILPWFPEVPLAWTSTYQRLQRLMSSTSWYGEELALKDHLHEYQAEFDQLEEIIGEVEITLAGLRLLRQQDYCLPEWISPTVSQGPYLQIEQMWHPKLGVGQTRNSIRLTSEPDAPQTMLITGANTSGKSTYLKTVILCVWLAQSFGVVPATRIHLTPFTILYSYLNVPDAVGRESLFEAEMNRCHEYLEMLQLLGPTQYTLTILDELFTGTNPIDGIASSYGMLKYLPRFPQSLQLISTHFHQVCSLAEDHPEHYQNGCFWLLEDSDSSDRYRRDYKLRRGCSRQCVGVELLSRRGFPEEIIQEARQITLQFESIEEPNGRNCWELEESPSPSRESVSEQTQSIPKRPDQIQKTPGPASSHRPEWSPPSPAPERIDTGSDRNDETGDPSLHRCSPSDTRPSPTPGDVHRRPSPPTRNRRLLGDSSGKCSEYQTHDWRPHPADEWRGGAPAVVPAPGSASAATYRRIRSGPAVVRNLS